MEKICYLFLAYGNQYVEQFLRISSFFDRENIIVCSNNNIEGFNTIVTNQDFNFNLKLFALIEALKHYDKVLLLDTDIVVKGVWKESLQKLPEGVSVKWVGNKVNYLNEILNSKNLSQGSTTLYDVNQYGKKLFKLNNNNTLKFIDESCIFFNFPDTNKKLVFIDNLKKTLIELKDYFPSRHGKKGSLEGCLLYVALLKSNIDIYNKKSVFSKMFYHYGPSFGHKINFNKKVI